MVGVRGSFYGVTGLAAGLAQRGSGMTGAPVIARAQTGQLSFAMAATVKKPLLRREAAVQSRDGFFEMAVGRSRNAHSFNSLTVASCKSS